MDVTIKNLEPMCVACVRHTGPYDQCHAAWKTLMEHAGRQGWIGGSVRAIGICHDDPETTPAHEIRYDACLTVGPAAQPEGDIHIKELPGGEYAAFVHRGPFDQIGASYKRFYAEWLPTSGREQAEAPHLEFYLKDPGSTPPEELETDICVPLK